MSISNPGKPAKPRGMRCDFAADTAVMAVLVGIVVAWGLGRVFWLADLVSHFWPWAGLLIVPAGLWKLFRRQLPAGVLTLLIMVIWVGPLLPYYWPQPAPKSGSTLRVVVCNLYSNNHQPEAAMGYLRSLDADLYVLLEVSPEWLPYIKPLQESHSHQKVIARDDNFGIAVLSREPMKEITQKNFGSSGVPTLVATFEDHPVVVVATHPLPPMGMNYADKRNRQLAEIAEFVRDSDAEVILAGDLNLTPWSVYFGDLLRVGRLRDSSRGRGIQPSWPSWTGLPLLPIDHALITDGLGVTHRSVGEPIGSDHIPVIVDLLLPVRTE
ncbi:hypothetical protein GC163_21855 [bacterium]|nr:hypothetical protein [bacterium]